MSLENRPEIFSPRDPSELSEDFLKCLDAIPRNTDPFSDFEFYEEEESGEYQARFESTFGSDAEKNNDPDEIYKRRVASLHKKAVMTQVRSLTDQAPISQGYREAIVFRFEELYIQGIDDDSIAVDGVDDPYFRFIKLIQLYSYDREVSFFYEDEGDYEEEKGQREATAYKLTLGQHLVDQVLYPIYENNEKVKDIIMNWRESYIEKYDKPPIDFEI